MFFSQNFDLKISLLIAVLGIFLLIFLEATFQPKQLPIGKISVKDLGSTVSVNARIDWFKKTNSAFLFGLNDGNKISAVIFLPKPGAISFLKKGALVGVVGKVSLFNEKLELIVEKVDLID